MGLVVTTREIAAQFGQDQEFFSTTGGNPVACAAALAMLDVMEEENLMENARKTGAKLKTGLEQLGTRHDLIGDVRGTGLFIGVELVTSRDSLEPAAAETRRIVNALRENHILVGIDGPYSNVIKIRPPMVFNDYHAELLLQQLEQVLSG
jgi:4-aminobutyrate aminotransferase-like enzyme